MLETLGGSGNGSFGTAPFLPVCSDQRQTKHRGENYQQAECGLGDAALVAREDGESTVDEFDMNPVDEKRSFAELDDWAEAGLREAPVTPGVRQKQDDKKETTAHEEEVWIRMPIVIDGVEVDWRFVEELRECACGNAADTDQSESKRFALLCEICVEEESDCEAGECERGPGEKRKKPGLRFVEDVDAVDVGLEWPGKKSRAMGCPKRRGKHGEESCDDKACSDGAVAGGGERFG